jgi:hypothetical protein
MNWKVLLKMEGETLFKRTATMEFPSKEKELDSTPNASKWKFIAEEYSWVSG